MEFLTERCYTALNADELKIGSKVIFAPTIGDLKQYVKSYCDALSSTVDGIMPEYSPDRFLSNDKCYNLAYLISEPKDWIVYLSRRKDIEPYLTACRSDTWEEVQKDFGAKTKLFEGTEDEVDNWYTARKHLANVIAAWEDGKAIQFFDDSIGDWADVEKPKWSTDNRYRIKPEEKKLKWTDLKIGDIICSGKMSYMITGIDAKNVTESHIHFAGKWRGDFELEGWEKVE